MLPRFYCYGSSIITCLMRKWLKTLSSIYLAPYFHYTITKRWKSRPYIWNKSVWSEVFGTKKAIFQAVRHWSAMSQLSSADFWSRGLRAWFAKRLFMSSTFSSVANIFEDILWRLMPSNNSLLSFLIVFLQSHLTLMLVGFEVSLQCVMRSTVYML